MSKALRYYSIQENWQLKDFALLEIHFFSVCDNGRYVKDKMCIQCPGHCKYGTPCNKLTGRCDNGCADHWTGEFCESTY